MSELHRRSIRLPSYDYTQPGAYFITLVTHHRKHIMGQIIDGRVILNDAGLIAKIQWERLAVRFHSLEVDEFVIMPNHIHGILWIGSRGTGKEFQKTGPGESPRAPTGESYGRPIPGSIPTIIRSYKSAVAFRLSRLLNVESNKIWQRNYYEHVIRSEQDLDSIRSYVFTNPSQWDRDPENMDRVLS